MASIPPKIKLQVFSAGQIALSLLLGGLGLLLIAAMSGAAKFVVLLAATVSILAVLFVRVRSFSLPAWLGLMGRYVLSARRFVWRRGAPPPAARPVSFPDLRKAQRPLGFLAHRASSVAMASACIVLVVALLTWASRRYVWIEDPASGALAIEAPAVQNVLLVSSSRQVFLPMLFGADNEGRGYHWACPWLSGSRGINDYVRIDNQEDRPATVTVTLLRSDGFRIGNVFTLPPHKQAMVSLTPAFVVPTVTLESDVPLAVTCHCVYYDDEPAVPQPLAHYWLITPSRVDSYDARVWYIRVDGQLDPRVYALYENEPGAELVFPPGGEKTIPDSVFTGNAPSGFLLISDQPFRAAGVWR